MECLKKIGKNKFSLFLEYDKISQTRSKFLFYQNIIYRLQLIISAKVAFKSGMRKKSYNENNFLVDSSDHRAITRAPACPWVFQDPFETP